MIINYILNVKNIKEDWKKGEKEEKKDWKKVKKVLYNIEWNGTNQNLSVFIVNRFQ